MGYGKPVIAGANANQSAIGIHSHADFGFHHLDKLGPGVCRTFCRRKAGLFGLAPGAGAIAVGPDALDKAENLIEVALDLVLAVECKEITDGRLAVLSLPHEIGKALAVPDAATRKNIPDFPVERGTLDWPKMRLPLAPPDGAIVKAQRLAIDLGRWRKLLLNQARIGMDDERAAKQAAELMSIAKEWPVLIRRRPD